MSSYMASKKTLEINASNPIMQVCAVTVVISIVLHTANGIGMPGPRLPNRRWHLHMAQETSCASWRLCSAFPDASVHYVGVGACRML